MLPLPLRVEKGTEQGNRSADRRIEINEEVGEQQRTRVTQQIADAARLWRVSLGSNIGLDVVICPISEGSF